MTTPFNDQQIIDAGLSTIILGGMNVSQGKVKDDLDEKIADYCGVCEEFFNLFKQVPNLSLVTDNLIFPTKVAAKMRTLINVIGAVVKYLEQQLDPKFKSSIDRLKILFVMLKLANSEPTHLTAFSSSSIFSSSSSSLTTSRTSFSHVPSDATDARSYVLQILSVINFLPEQHQLLKFLQDFLPQDYNYEQLLLGLAVVKSQLGQSDYKTTATHNLTVRLSLLHEIKLVLAVASLKKQLPVDLIIDVCTKLRKSKDSARYVEILSGIQDLFIKARVIQNCSTVLSESVTDELPSTSYLLGNITVFTATEVAKLMLYYLAQLPSQNVQAVVSESKAVNSVLDAAPFEFVTVNCVQLSPAAKVVSGRSRSATATKHDDIYTLLDHLADITRSQVLREMAEQGRAHLSKNSGSLRRATMSEKNLNPTEETRLLAPMPVVEQKQAVVIAKAANEFKDYLHGTGKITAKEIKKKLKYFGAEISDDDAKKIKSEFYVRHLSSLDLQQLLLLYMRYSKFIFGSDDSTNALDRLKLINSNLDIIDQLITAFITQRISSVLSMPHKLTYKTEWQKWPKRPVTADVEKPTRFYHMAMLAISVQKAIASPMNLGELAGKTFAEQVSLPLQIIMKALYDAGLDRNVKSEMVKQVLLFKIYDQVTAILGRNQLELITNAELIISAIATYNYALHQMVAQIKATNITSQQLQNLNNMLVKLFELLQFCASYTHELTELFTLRNPDVVTPHGTTTDLGILAFDASGLRIISDSKNVSQEQLRAIQSDLYVHAPNILALENNQTLFTTTMKNTLQQVSRTLDDCSALYQQQTVAKLVDLDKVLRELQALICKLLSVSAEQIESMATTTATVSSSSSSITSEICRSISS